jgi:hypothetical protein
MAKKNILKMPTVPKTLQEAFDFSVQYVTADEVNQIRFALQNETLIVTDHAASAAKDDAVTVEQIFYIIANGVPISKDLDNRQNRQSGVNFEGRAGGQRKVRVKVSWQKNYYVVTVHTILKIKRKR